MDVSTDTVHVPITTTAIFQTCNLNPQWSAASFYHKLKFKKNYWYFGPKKTKLELELLQSQALELLFRTATI